MPALATVVADLLAHPRPVLLLDTCDLLDIIQCVAEGKAGRLEHVRRLVTALGADPDRLQLVVSYLVPVEWAQNQAIVLADVELRTRRLDQDIADIHRAWQHAGSQLPGPTPSYAGSGLTAALAALAGTILGWAVVLDPDETCIGRALDRVHTKGRPSHTGMVKDSIHLEHYLELCRQLHTSAFPGRRVFVSANKADFWAAKNRADIHPDLEPQLTAVGLEFFGTLEAALGSLGI
jgi:hypothetical protein